MIRTLVRRRFLVAMFLGALAHPALAWQPPASPAAETIDAAKLTEPKELLSREIVRLALLDLRAMQNPKAEDYRGVLAMLSIAHDLDPKNTDIIRRQIEAAFSAGDQPAVIEHTRALLLLDPSDTVAQLRFITDSIARQHQNAEDRLAAYESFINSKSIDPSIRSRLALDAALLLRERGDEKGFNAKLIQSLKLDSSHKEAAAFAATYFADRVADDPAGRLDLLINLLKADPLDPNVHFSIAKELAAAGAHIPAFRFHSNAVNIANTLGTNNPEFRVQNLVLRWNVDGPQLIVRAISEGLAAQRDAAAREFRRKHEGNPPPGAKPEEVRLPPSLVMLSVLAADAAGDRIAVENGVKEFADQVARTVETLKDPKARGQMTQAQAVSAALEAMIQLFTLKLWVDVDAAKAPQMDDALKGIRLNYPETADVLDALFALRAGHPEETIERCKNLDAQQRMGNIAMGLAYEALGRKDDAIAQYLSMARSEPFQIAAAWCRSRVASLGYVEDKKSAKALERLVDDPRVPAWIDRMALFPGEFVRVTCALPVTDGQAGDFIPIKVTITNQSDIPLALGADRPISSRLVLLCKMARGVPDGLVRPEIVDLDQRLRLMPRETIEMEVWPGLGQSGWVIDSLANRSTAVRWRLIQGFVMDSQGSFRSGVMGAESETDSFLFRPLADSSVTADELAQRITAAPLSALPRLALLTRAFVLQPVLLPDPLRFKPIENTKDKPVALPREITAVKPGAQAFAARYASLSPVQRALLAVILPHAKLSPDMAPFDAVVRADQDPVVRCIALCSRVSDPSDELLKASAASDDPRVREVAAVVAFRLATPSKVFARLTPEDLAKPPAKPAEGGAGATK